MPPYVLADFPPLLVILVILTILIQTISAPRR